MALGRLDDELEVYFARLRAALERRLDSGTAATRQSYRIAGQTIALSCAGAGLAAFLLPALQHLADDTAHPPALEVDAFEAGEELPGLPAALLAAAARADTPDAGPGSASSPVYTYIGRRHHMTWFTAASHREITLLDVDRGRAMVSVQPAAGGTPSLPASAPLRSLFALWFEHHSLTLVHAAAVGTEHGGILIAAKSGGGKSTIALACLGTGLRCAGDDSLLVENRADGVRVHSLYCSGSVSTADVALYPALRGLALKPRLDRPKVQFFLGQRSGWLAATLTLRAIVVPELVERPGSRLAPTAPSQALLVLGPSSINLAGGRPAERLARIGALARVVPCFTLDLGRHLADVPAVLRDLLGQLSAAATAA